MNIRSFLFAGVVISCFALSICAQKSAPVRFTSIYTSLGAGCKTLRGHSGQDDASLCKGPAGYQVRVYSSATTTQIMIELKGTDDTFPLANVSLAFNESKSRIEWRLANGKPFAAIMRVPTYADRTDGEAGVGKVIGQELTITGLKGFENIGTTVDAKTQNANAKAREEADKAYAAAKK